VRRRSLAFHNQDEGKILADSPRSHPLTAISRIFSCLPFSPQFVAASFYTFSPQFAYGSLTRLPVYDVVPAVVVSGD